MDTFYATYAAWAEAFSIFAKYEPDATFEVSAEHDVIYAGRAVGKYSEDDKARLADLHWYHDEDLECYYRFT